MSNVLIIGAGGVAHVAAHKCAQNNHILGNICIASRTPSKCDSIIDSIMRKQSLRDKSKVITASEVDISSVKDIKKIINNTNSKIVLNLASPWLSTNVMQACLDADANYIDTSVCTDLFSKGQEVPSCYDPQWAFRDQFKDKGITGILGIGFDPGVGG